MLEQATLAHHSIHNLLVSEKIIDAKKIHVSRLSKKAKEAAAKAVAEKAAAVAPAVTPIAEAPAAPVEEKPAA